MPPLKPLKTMNKTQLIGITALASMASSSVFAANINWDGSTDGNFNIGANWGNGSGPVDGNTYFIRTGANLDNIFQTAQDRTIDRLGMGENGSASSEWTLNIKGGSINTNGAESPDPSANNIGQQSLGTTSLNVKGGAFTATNFTNVGGAGGSTFLNVTDGILDIATARFGNGGASATLSVTGDTITTLSGTDFEFLGNGILDFNFNETGVKPLSLDSLIAASGTLSVDLTGYNGGSTTITLADVTGGTGITSAFGTVNVTEGAYVGSFVTQDLGTDLITLTIVPEPGTYALLGGLLALSYVMVRRRS